MLNVYAQGDLERDLREIFETEQIVTIYDSPDDTDIYYADNSARVDPQAS